MRYIFLQLFLLVLGACSTSLQLKQLSVTGTMLTIDRIKTLIPGRVFKNDVSKVIGHPQEIINHLGNEVVTWEYLDARGRQAVFAFEGKSGKLKSIILELRRDDPEAKWDDFKSVYPHALFKRKASLPAGHDVVEAPGTNYTDSNLGITILVKEDLNQIEAVSWFGPTITAERKPATN